MAKTDYKNIVVDNETYWIHLPTNSLLPNDNEASKLLRKSKEDLELLKFDKNNETVLRTIAILDMASSLKKEKSNKIKRVAISITMECNLSCKYCYNTTINDKNIRSTANLSSFCIEKIIDNLLKLPLNEDLSIIFIGGEPLLYPDILEDVIIKIKNQFGHSIRLDFSVTTNGLHLGHQNIIKMINRHRINVAISIDGSKEYHNENRIYLDGRGSYDALQEQLLIFLPQFWSKIFSARATVKFIPGRLVETYSHLVKMGFNDIAIGSSDFSTDLNWHKNIKLIYIDIEELFKIVKNNYIDNKIYRFSWALDVFRNLYFGRSKSFVCGAAQNYVAFDPNGDIKICHRFQGNSQVFLSINDILNPYESSDLLKIFNDSRTNECNICWARYLCGGECYHVDNEMMHFGERELKRKYSCLFKKKMILESIKTYIRLYNFSPELAEIASSA